RGGGSEAACFQLCQDEMVDAVLWPTLVTNRRQQRIAGRLERPILARIRNVRISHPAARVWRSTLHPGFKCPDLLHGEASLGRHFQFRVAVADRLDEETFLRLAWHDHRAGIAPF